MLREDAGPVFRAQIDIDTSVFSHVDPRMLALHDRIDRLAATFDNAWVPLVEGDAKVPDVPIPTDVAVAEVQPRR